MVVIVISGSPGAGSTTIAKRLSEELGLKHYSVGAQFKKLGVGKGEAVKALNLLGTYEGKSEKLHRKLDQEQIRVSEEGDVVIDGKMSIHLLKRKANLTVWIKCPLRVRAKHAAKRDGITVEEAERVLKDRERIEKELFKKLYGINYLKQEQKADLVVDSSTQSVNKIVNIIKNEVRKVQKPCEN